MSKRKPRRRFSPEFKARVGIEAARGVKTVNKLIRHADWRVIIPERGFHPKVRRNHLYPSFAVVLSPT